MKYDSLHLKVLLPFRVFTEIKNVQKMVAETGNGSFGILPNRLDCVASLVPGIFSYETADKQIHYLGIDEGVLVKTGNLVLVSVRNAIGEVDLGKLRTAIQKEFQTLNADEINVRSVIAKLETGFIRNFEKLRHGG